MIVLVILGVAILLEIWSFRTAIHEARPHKGSSIVASHIRHAREPELPVVLLLEDLVIGLGCFGQRGSIVAEVTGDAMWDGIGTLGIGILLGVIAIVLRDRDEGTAHR